MQAMMKNLTKLITRKDFALQTYNFFLNSKITHPTSATLLR